MATKLLQRLTINDDVDAEFLYWKNQFIFSAWTAVGFAGVTGFAIAAWPAGAGDPEMRAFARQFWTLLAECMFWLGFLLGLMWAGAKRFGGAISGTLPWQPAQQIGSKLARSRLLGQWAAGLFLLGTGFWMTEKIAMQAEEHGIGFLKVLHAAPDFSFAGAILCAIGAVVMRSRSG
ncbi:MAG TPA: hypothetical protein VGE12_06285 [Noviherbaspirillum sp.]